jgi:hypothetical protein
MDFIIQLLGLLVPTGALGGVAYWLTSRKIRKLRDEKEENDTYKEMHKNDREILIEQQDDIKKLTKSVRQLERAVSRAVTCRYYDTCPIRRELQNQSADTGARCQRKQPTNRQREPGDGKADESDTGTGVAGDADAVI